MSKLAENKQVWAQPLCSFMWPWWDSLLECLTRLPCSGGREPEITGHIKAFYSLCCFLSWVSVTPTGTEVGQEVTFLGFVEHSNGSQSSESSIWVSLYSIKTLVFIKDIRWDVRQPRLELWANQELLVSLWKGFQRPNFSWVNLKPLKLSMVALELSSCGGSALMMLIQSLPS